MEVEKKESKTTNALEESKQLFDSFQESKQVTEKKTEEEDKGAIKFTQKLHDKYGFLGNLFECKINIDGLQFKSVEHYYQAMKYEGTKKFEVVRRAGKPIDAHKLAQKKDVPKNKDWNDLKLVYMRKAIQAKFDQNEGLKKQLIETGNQSLLDMTSNHKFWAMGDKEAGQNFNGKILEAIRAKYINEIAEIQQVLQQE